MVKQVAAAGPVEGPWALPDGWRWEALGNLGTWSGGGTPSKARPDFWTDGTIPWVSPKDMKRPLIDSSEDTITASAVAGSSAKVVSAGSVLCVMRSGILRHTFPVAVNTVDVTLNQDMRALTPRLDVEPRYLSYYLHFTGQTVLHTASKAGTTVNSIEAGRLDRHPVPLGSIGRQRAIVARIDELFAEIDDGEAALTRAREDLATWRKALLKAAVTGELTADWRAANPASETGAALLKRILDERRARWEAEPTNKGKRYKAPLPLNGESLPVLPEGWVWAAFDQLIDQLSNGISVKPAHTPPGVPILRISSVRAMMVRDDQRRWLPEEFPVGAALARHGDLLFTRYNGNPDLVGICGRYRGKTPIAYPDKVMCARLSSANEAVGDFIELAMNAGASRKHISAYTKTSAGQHGVAGSTVKVAPVPIPPEAELEQIVRVFRDATAQAEEGWSDAIELTTISATLRQSVLAAAFRGELA